MSDKPPIIFTYSKENNLLHVTKRHRWKDSVTSSRHKWHDSVGRKRGRKHRRQKKSINNRQNKEVGIEKIERRLGE